MLACVVHACPSAEVSQYRVPRCSRMRIQRCSRGSYGTLASRLTDPPTRCAKSIRPSEMVMLAWLAASGPVLR